MLKQTIPLPEELKSMKEVISLQSRKLTQDEIDILIDKLYSYAFLKQESLYFILEGLLMSYFAPTAKSFDEGYKQAPSNIKQTFQASYTVLNLAVRGKIQTDLKP